MSRIWVLMLLFLIASPLCVKAQPVTLTLENAVQLALNQSINLKKASIDLSQSEYSATHLWSEIFPGFSLSAGMTFLPSTPLFTDPGFSYNSNSLSYTLNFGISLSLNTSLASSMKRIDLAYRTRLLSYESAGKQLEIQVIKNFLRLITLKEHIAYMEESLELAEQKLEKDRVARENGLLSELDWLNARLSAETARYNLGSAQATYLNDLGEFLALLGMESGTDIDFRGTVAIAPVLSDPEQLILDYLPKRPDIIAQRRNIEMLELGRSITALNSRSPTLGLSGSWRGGTPGSNTKGLAGQFTDNVSGSLTLTIPIDSWIPGTRQNQTVRSADAEVEKAKLDLRNTETGAKTQIRSLISNLHNTWANLEIALLRVEIAERTTEAAEEGFRNGTVEFQDLENRRNDLTDARQRLLQGEYSYQSLLLDLAAALNVDWRTLTGQQANQEKEG